MKKALIQNGNVVQVSTASFPVHSSLEWVDVADDVTTEWTWSGAAAVAPVPVDNAPGQKAQALSDAKEKAIEAILQQEGTRGPGALKAAKDYVALKNQSAPK